MYLKDTNNANTNADKVKYMNPHNQETFETYIEITRNDTRKK